MELRRAGGQRVVGVRVRPAKSKDDVRIDPFARDIHDQVAGGTQPDRSFSTDTVIKVDAAPCMMGGVDPVDDRTVFIRQLNRRACVPRYPNQISDPSRMCIIEALDLRSRYHLDSIEVGLRATAENPEHGGPNESSTQDDGPTLWDRNQSLVGDDATFIDLDVAQAEAIDDAQDDRRPAPVFNRHGNAIDQHRPASPCVLMALVVHDHKLPLDFCGVDDLVPVDPGRLYCTRLVAGLVPAIHTLGVRGSRWRRTVALRMIDGTTEPICDDSHQSANDDRQDELSPTRREQDPPSIPL